MIHEGEMQMVKTVSIAKDNNALKKAYAIRRQVFIEEQNVPFSLYSHNIKNKLAR